MGPVVLVFFGIPTVLTVVDEGLKWFLHLRSIHRAKKRIDETGEQTEAPVGVDEVDDDMLYPVCIDALVSGSVIKELNRCDVWRDMVLGAELAQQLKKKGEFPSCESCGRFAMN